MIGTVLHGWAIEASAPKSLEGDYLVSWTAQPPNHVGCYHGASLNHPGSRISDAHLANELIHDGLLHRGTTNVYGLKSGQYYVDASSGCDWSFTFAPR